MDFQSTDRRNQDNTVGSEATVVTLDVEKLLHADVCTEPRLRRERETHTH